MLTDFHNHTTFCDGHATPEEMVQAAIERGFTQLGLLVHSYTWFDTSYCMAQGRETEFQREIARLKDVYRDRITLYCGVEQDRYSTASTAGFDYVIGSVHYVYADGEYPSIDHTADGQRALVERYYGGDWYAFAEAYFAAVAEVAEVTRPDIIGHFDLAAKFNGGGTLFDEQHPRYVVAWQAAVEALLPYGIPFEINVGGMLRAGRSEPYPSLAIQRYLAERGARVVMSGDNHRAVTLGQSLDDWKAAAQRAGFTEQQIITHIGRDFSWN